ncbi:unnamed protein product, partial [Mesorhabditis spiculigera]
MIRMVDREMVGESKVALNNPHKWLVNKELTHRQLRSSVYREMINHLTVEPVDPTLINKLMMVERVFMHMLPQDLVYPALIKDRFFDPDRVMSNHLLSDPLTRTMVDRLMMTSLERMMIIKSVMRPELVGGLMACVQRVDTAERMMTTNLMIDPVDRAVNNTLMVDPTDLAMFNELLEDPINRAKVKELFRSGMTPMAQES